MELTTECYYMWEKLAGETCRTLIKYGGSYIHILYVMHKHACAYLNYCAHDF